MDKFRALLACLCHLAPVGRRAMGGVMARFTRVWYSIQDHATPLVVTSWTLIVGGLVLLALSDTKAVTFVKDYQPVIALVAVITGASVGTLKWLKEKRDNRLALPPQNAAPVVSPRREPDASLQPPDPVSASGPVNTQSDAARS